VIGTAEGFRAYAGARGWEVTADDLTITQALQRSTDHILIDYVARFKSGYDETAPNVIPATYEAARLELATPGFFSTTRTPGQQKELVQVADIKWQLTGDGGKGPVAPISTRVEALLAPYLPASRGVGVSTFMRT
jgi:hypothetical protein